MDLSLDGSKIEKQTKKNKCKNSSMNQSLLSRIVKDKLPLPRIKKRITTSCQDSVESMKIEDRNISFNSNRIHDFEQTVASKYKKSNGIVIHTAANGKNDSIKTCLKKVYSKFHTFHNKVPKCTTSAENRYIIPQIKPNNSTSYLEKLKIDLIYKNSLKSDQTLDRGKIIDYKKILEELMEAKHKNSKLENEMKLLNDKLKSFKSIINMKNNEVEIINKKHKDILDELKKDVERNKKTVLENRSLKDSVNKHNVTLKSTINILIDVIEILITQKMIPINPNFTKSLSVSQNTGQQGENNSNISIDMYDSYNNEEEKKSNLVEQILSVIMVKMSYLKKTFNLDFDKEIQRIKNWNCSQKINQDNSFANLKLSYKKDLSSSESERSKRINEKSYDLDLSVSNQLTNPNQSPKFYNDISLLDYCKDKLSFNDSKAKEERIINQTMNDSISLAVGQIESFEEKKTIIIRDEENLDKNSIKKNSINRNAANGMKRLNLDLNDNPTDFNVDIFLSLKNESSFMNNGSTVPVILSPIFGNKNGQNISFMD